MQEKDTHRIKLIQINDHAIDHKHHFPFIHSIKSQIRFRLRSKIVYHYEPIILIQKNITYQCSLPLKQNQNINMDKFHIIKGTINQSGSWQANLNYKQLGLICYQLVFLDRVNQNKVNVNDEINGNKTVVLGQHDVILIVQNKYDLRKLRKLTVFPRCIGEYKQWTSFFIRQRQLGYNTFHLAPIQITGSSQSYYSISNHLELTNDCFSGSNQQKYQQLNSILDPLKKQGVIFFMDIVLNHTSFDSKWIAPQCVFTPENTPLLKPAYEVDCKLYEWGEKIKNELLQKGQELTEQKILEFEIQLIEVITSLKLEQYFMLNQSVQEQLFKRVQPRKIDWNLFEDDPIDTIDKYLKDESMGIEINRKGKKLQNYQKWQKINLQYSYNDLITAIQRYNLSWQTKVQQVWVPQIINHTIQQIRRNYIINNYRSLYDHYSFITRYFSIVKDSEDQNFSAVNNGWVFGVDSSINFALSEQMYYLRRRVNVWGDLLRIRYGKTPQDSPKAWQYMSKYVREMAKYFNGFRLDNLHGTQLNVARHMISQARKINPQLIIFAQLFTNSEEQTAIFSRTIGFNSILMQAQNLLEGNKFMKQFYCGLSNHGKYVGSLNNYLIQNGQKIKYSNRKKPIQLIYDLTHDNKTYVNKNIHILQTPISCLLSLMGTFVGSTKGYDQFYTNKVSVTQKKALYKQDKIEKIQTDKSQVQKYKIIVQCKSKCSVFGDWNNWQEELKMNEIENSDMKWLEVELPPGKYEYKFKSDNRWFLDEKIKQINKNNNHQISIKKGQETWKYIYANLQQFRIISSNYTEKYYRYNQYYGYNIDDIVIIYRQDHNHEESICIIVNLSINQVQLANNVIKLPGCFSKADIWLQSSFSLYQGLITSSEIQYHHNLNEYFQCYYNCQQNKDYLRTNIIPSGFACVIQCHKSQSHKAAIRNVRTLCQQNIQLPPLGALDYNYILYGCKAEEEKKYGQSNYVLPQNNQQLVYAGIAGIIQKIKSAKKYNILTNNLFSNLRQGNWLLQYYIQRMKKFKNLSEITNHMQHVFLEIKKLPRYLIPKYFSDFIYNFYNELQNQISGVKNNIFKQQLQLSIPQFLTTLSSDRPIFRTLMAAGLPHFCVGWTRSWGRDTFICNELLLEHPNLYREIILQFASTQRHGMIPNLLDSGINPRYNCRDACWWFIRGINQYIKKTEDYKILKEKINMIFLSNDLSQHNKLQQQKKKHIMLLQEIIHHIFQSHANDIHYRQWHAGYEIDSNMRSQGFNIHLEVEQQTGFINGGNFWNCLTWMDKMGSSKKALNHGVPATPRAGCPVQLVGLLKYCLDSYIKLYSQGKYSYDNVVFKKRTIKYQQWSELIMKNFQKQFYIPQTNTTQQLHCKYPGIYKDVVHSVVKFEEIRLRPNALITLALAPQLCEFQHGKNYLKNVEKYLIHDKSIGIATLGENHTSLYSSYYDNNQDSSNLITAHGFSYHNGPEWIWLYGFYLCAKINFSKQSSNNLMVLLQQHVKYLQSSSWCSLPEITNFNGQYNLYGCNAQAWSISSLLMAVQKIQNINKDK